MRVIHISASLSRKAGGIFEIELALARQLAALGIDVTAFGLEDEEWESDKCRWQGIDTKVFDAKGPGFFGYAPEMFEAMLNSHADVAHLHYMWMYPSVATRQWHRKTKKPYVVTPNGMLEPWALSNSAWKKKLAGLAYENRMLHSAACLQANTEKEAADFRAYGLKNPVCIIPNGVDLVEAETLKTETLKSEKKILLFLGRLHPKKGLVNALRAWAEIRGRTSEAGDREEWTFVIAGWDQGGHEAELKELATGLGIRWADVRDRDAGSSNFNFQLSEFQLLFTGPAFGDEKDALLRRADCFILPSFSEGLPMSVLEAMAYRLPVLMTDHCNLPEGFAADAAIRIGTDVESIAEGMRHFLRSPTSDLRSLGLNGRALVERQFTWPQVAAQMKEVYEWLLGRGEKPTCVREL